MHIEIVKCHKCKKEFDTQDDLNSYFCPKCYHEKPKKKKVLDDALEKIENKTTLAYLKK